MMAKQHANLGVAGYIGLIVAASAVGVTEASDYADPAALGTLAVVAGGFALMPDLDEPGSTVSRKLGPLSRAFAAAVKVVAFGHRGATHSLLFALLMGALGLALGDNPVAFAVIVTLSASLIVRLVLPANLGYTFYTPVVLGAAVVSSVFAARLNIPENGLAFAMFAGVLLHVLGDTLTPSGTRVLWPLPVDFKLPLNGRTGAARETYVTQPLLIAAVLYTSWTYVIDPLMQSSDAISQALR